MRVVPSLILQDNFSFSPFPSFPKEHLGGCLVFDLVLRARITSRISTQANKLILYRNLYGEVILVSTSLRFSRTISKNAKIPRSLLKGKRENYSLEQLKRW